MKHLGDITKIHGDAVPIVDVITGGSPCQDLSCAGKRAGLAGERSGLFMEQIRIIKEMRDESRKRLHDAGADYNRTDVKPRYMVWENVPGAFSSNKGEDFRAVLEETAKVAERNAVIPGPPGGKWSHAGCIMGNGWSIAWRLHDAQFWGVPQRRKRIALVADFGGESAPEILFERKGLSGDIAQSGKEGESVTEDTERRAGEASYTLKVRGGAEFDRYGKRAGKGALVQTELSGTLGVSQDQTLIQCMNPWDVQSKHIQPENGVAEPLYAGECRGGGGESYVMQATAFEPGAMSRVGGHAYEDVAGTVRANAGDNQQAVVYGIGSYDSNGMKSDNPHSGIYEADTSRTLDLNGGNPGCNQGGMMVVQGFDGYNQQSTGDVAMPLRNKAADSDHIPVVCIEGNGSRPSHQGDGWHEGDPMYTLNSTEHHAVCAGFSTEHSAKSRSIGYEEEISPTLRAGVVPAAMAVENHPADSRVKISEDGVVQTLSGRMGTGGGNVPMVMESKAVESHAQDARYNVGNVNQPLTANMEHDPANGGLVMEQGFAMQAIGEYKQSNATSSLKMRDYKDATDLVVSYGLDRAAYNQGQNAKFGKVGAQTAKGPGAVCSAVDCRNGVEDENVNGSLQSRASNNTNSNNVCRVGSVVRRLTPLECERLQGFPDNWTNIGDWVDSKGKTHKGESDSPRYKALGNSIALPFWQWMAERMMPYLPENPTMASLFDGIGGFPLVFSRCGCKPVWASEIEEFPIAVTKKRFGEE